MPKIGNFYFVLTYFKKILLTQAVLSLSIQMNKLKTNILYICVLYIYFD